MSGVSRIVVDGVTYYNHDGETWEEVCHSSLGERDRLNHKNPPGNNDRNTFAESVNNIWYKVVHVNGQLIRRDNVKVQFYYFDENEKPIEIHARPPVSICNILSQDFEHAKKKRLFYTETKDEQTPSTCSMQGGKSKRKSNRKRQQRRTKRRQQKSKRRQRK